MSSSCATNPRTPLEAEAGLYSLLSRLYAAPAADLQQADLWASARADAATLGLTRIDGLLADLAAHVARSADNQELDREYVRLFHGPVRARAYPYESMYVDGEPMGPSALAVVQRYAQAGLGPSEGFGDLPDHISTELEFMYYLSAMESRCLDQGDETGRSQVSRLRREFLGEHLASWVPVFARTVIENTISPFYRDLAQVTREFLVRPEAMAVPSDDDNRPVAS